jgi:hypothetical protein
MGEVVPQHSGFPPFLSELGQVKQNSKGFSS